MEEELESHRDMSRDLPSEFLMRLIAANAPLWAGEAEVFRAYWDSAIRDPVSDRLWLLRQAYKEYWDGFVPHLAAVERMTGVDQSAAVRREALEATRIAAEEYAHFCLFADAWHSLGEEADTLHPQWLRQEGDWTENRELMELRERHKTRHGALGERAHRFTEGGYCTLYREGMLLGGRGGVDDVIAAACASVYEEEFDHMLMGIAGMDKTGIGEDEWLTLEQLSTEQMRYRIRMRNAQFSYPLSEQRVRELCEGVAEPLEFDFGRAGFSAAA
jgi:hypothetical protein